MPGRSRVTCSTPSTTGTAGPLDEVSARLRHAGVLDLVVGRVQGEHWEPLSDVAVLLEGWHADLTRRHGDPRAAAAYLAAWVAGAPALVVGLPAIADNLVVDVDAPSVHLYRHPQGFVDRHAVAPARVRREPDAIVLAAAAERVAHLAAPLVERLSADLPIGRVAVWGGVADALVAHALWFARQGGTDQTSAWARSDLLLDRLGQVAPLRRRPTLFPVTWSGGTAYYPVRSTCCLYYRTEAAAGPEGPTYCATCPRRGDQSRTACLVAHLESSP